MHATRRTARLQQKHIKFHRTNSNSYRFFNLLTSRSLLDKVESLLPEHRERLFPPTETLSMFLAQAMSADRSCQNIVNRAAVERLSGGLPLCSTHTGAYCRARQRLSLEMVSGLTRHVGKLLDSETSAQWRWNQRPVRVVDGTTVTMPDTLENQQAFPQSNAQKPGLGFPICRVVGITCLSSGALQDAAIGPVKERAAMSKHYCDPCRTFLSRATSSWGMLFLPRTFYRTDASKRGGYCDGTTRLSKANGGLSMWPPPRAKGSSYRSEQAPHQAGLDESGMLSVGPRFPHRQRTENRG